MEMIQVAVGYDDDREAPLDADNYEHAFTIGTDVWDRAESSFAMGIRNYARAAEAIIRGGGRIGSVTVNPA